MRIYGYLTWRIVSFYLGYVNKSYHKKILRTTHRFFNFYNFILERGQQCGSLSRILTLTKTSWAKTTRRSGPTKQCVRVCGLLAGKKYTLIIFVRIESDSLTDIFPCIYTRSHPRSRHTCSTHTFNVLQVSVLKSESPTPTLDSAAEDDNTSNQTSLIVDQQSRSVYLSIWHALKGRTDKKLNFDGWIYMYIPTLWVILGTS